MVMMTMIKSEGFRWVSSAAAVYSMAITSSAGQQTYTSSTSTCKQEEKSATVAASTSMSSSEAVQGVTQATSKFAPSFDGLRFIETLVTAHR